MATAAVSSPLLGPLWSLANTEDKVFLKRSSESDSGHNTEGALGDDDPDYVSSEPNGTDGDDEDDDID